MSFLSPTEFLVLTDKIGYEAYLLTAQITAANATGSHGPTYNQVSNLQDPQVESNALMQALTNFDNALLRDRIIKAMTQWGDWIGAVYKSLSAAGISGGIDGFCSLNNIRCSRWFSVVHNAVKGYHLLASSVFPEDPNTLGLNITLATLTINSFSGHSQSPSGFTGVTGITAIQGDAWPQVHMGISFNSLYTVNNQVRIGVGTGKFAEFSATDPTVYNAAASQFYVKFDTDPTVGLRSGIDMSTVLRLYLVDSTLIPRVRYVTFPTGTLVGDIVVVPGGQYLQLNKVDHVFGGELNATFTIHAETDRTIH